jgi:ATP-dependent RNA helicase DDX60
LYVFVTHCVILENLSVEERARSVLPVLNERLERDVREVFLERMFLVVDAVLCSRGTGEGAAWIDIDGRVFMTLLHFILANASSSSSIQELVGENVYRQVETIWSSTNPPVDFLKFSQFFPLPPPPEVPPPVVTENVRKQEYTLLPFNNKVFDEELSSIRVNVLPPSTSDPSPLASAHLEFGSQGGIIFSDTQHWHNTHKSILPSHHGGGKQQDPKPALTEWQKRKKLRSEQRFMATLQQQAGTLTGALGAVLKQIVIPPVGSGSGSGSVQAGKGKGKGVAKVCDFLMQLVNVRILTRLLVDTDRKPTSLKQKGRRSHHYPPKKSSCKR